MRPTLLPLLSLLAAACATLGGPSDAEIRYREGVDALARSDFAAATASLEFVSRAEDPDLSVRALLLLTSIELDPSNPSRDLDAAAGLAARVMESSSPVSTEYLAAAALERVARETLDLQRGLADTQRLRNGAIARADSLWTKLDSATSERDAARRRVTRLEELGDSLKEELKVKTQELERIRRAIRG